MEILLLVYWNLALSNICSAIRAILISLLHILSLMEIIVWLRWESTAVFVACLISAYLWVCMLIELAFCIFLSCFLSIILINLYLILNTLVYLKKIINTNLKLSIKKDINNNASNLYKNILHIFRTLSLKR